MNPSDIFYLFGLVIIFDLTKNGVVRLHEEITLRRKGQKWEPEEVVIDMSNPHETINKMKREWKEVIFTYMMIFWPFVGLFSSQKVLFSTLILLSLVKIITAFKLGSPIGLYFIDRILKISITTLIIYNHFLCR